VYRSVIDEFHDSTTTLYECDAYNWSCSHFCDIFAYFGQKLVVMATSLRPLQSEMSFLDWPTTKTPCICNNFIPKLVAMVTPLCPLCTWDSQMNSLISQTLPQNKTLHGYVAYNWSYGQFCDFWPILAKIWLPVSITFGIRPIKHVTICCDKFGDIQLWVAPFRRQLVQQVCIR